MIYQYTKQVVFNSPGLVDFAVRLVFSFKQLKFVGQISAEVRDEIFFGPCENNFQASKTLLYISQRASPKVY